MKKLFLAIIIFLLTPIIVNATNLDPDNFFCKYKRDTSMVSDVDDFSSKPFYDYWKLIFKTFYGVGIQGTKESNGFGSIKFIYYYDTNLSQGAPTETQKDDEGNHYHVIYTNQGGEEKSIQILSTKFSFSDFSNYIAENDECPPSVDIFPNYVETGDGSNMYTAKGKICFDDYDYFSCDTDEPPVVFNSVTTGSPVIDPLKPATSECTDKNLKCEVIDAIYCRKYSVRAHKYGNGIVEFGHSADGTRYFAVTFPGYATGIVNNNGVSYRVKVDTYTFTIDRNFWNELYVDKCNYKDISLALEESEDYGGTIAKIVENINGDGEIETPPVDIQKINFCAEARVLRAFKIGGYLLFALKILVPLIIIILGSIDFAKAVIDTGDKANKEALSMLIKRLIIGIIIFLLPTILDFLLGFIDGAKETHDGFSACTHCLFSPFDGSCDKEINDMAGRGVEGNGGNTYNNKGGTTINDHGSSHHSGSFGDDNASGSGGRGYGGSR